MFVWLFGEFRSTRELFTHMETSPLPVEGCKFDLCSALMAIEQWGFLSVSNLLWYGAYVCNGHFQGPVTLTPSAERLVVELSLPVFTTKICRGWDSNTQPSAVGANDITHCRESWGRTLLCCTLFKEVSTNWMKAQLYPKPNHTFAVFEYWFSQNGVYKSNFKMHIKY